MQSESKDTFRECLDLLGVDPSSTKEDTETRLSTDGLLSTGRIFLSVLLIISISNLIGSSPRRDALRPDLTLS